MQDFRKLQVWEKSHDLTLRIYDSTSGSASETEYLIPLAHGLKYLNPGQYAELIDAIIRVKKMLTALLKKLRA